MKKPYFLYVGNAYPHKNLVRLIKAAEGVARLVIVSPRSVFRKRLERKGAELLGFVSDAQLAKLYKGAVAFVYPSLSEGFGLPGLEAIKSGTLVLASDIPVFREIYQDKATYFDPYDSASIKRSMEYALSLSSVERQRIIRDGQKFVKRYSWRKMAEETLQVYKSV